MNVAKGEKGRCWVGGPEGVAGGAIGFIRINLVVRGASILADSTLIGRKRMASRHLWARPAGSVPAVEGWTGVACVRRGETVCVGGLVSGRSNFKCREACRVVWVVSACAWSVR